MKIIVAKHGGFCPGLRRAVRLVLEENKKRPPARTLGPLLHNAQFVRKLEEKNIRVIDDIRRHEGGSVVTRSHGVALETLRQAERENIPVVEATCVFVKKARKIAVDLKKEGRRVIIFGSPEHPEVVGVNSFIEYDAVVVDSLDEAKQLPRYEKAGVISQTTRNRDLFNKIVEELRKRCDDLKAVDTICDSAKQRQEEAERVARKADVMIVVGGKHSSNTVNLLGVCQKHARSYHIETAEELRPEWFAAARTTGVAIGASTPDYITDEVVARLKNFGRRPNPFR